MDFSYHILSVDQAAQSMVVEFKSEHGVHALNLPLAPSAEELDAHIAQFAPLPIQVAQTHVPEVGATGTFTKIQHTEDAGESANMVGNWSEEYLRAMIYQVMEEIRESQA